MDTALRIATNTTWGSMGRMFPVEELTHQHLSNVLWFMSIIGRSVPSSIKLELDKRFDGQKLFYKPLPIPGELKYLNKAGALSETGNIVVYNEIIGSVTHIDGWEQIAQIEEE